MKKAGEGHHLSPAAHRSPATAISEVISALSCPSCGEDLALCGECVRCPQGHSFDIARQGYVNLVSGGRRSHPGDTAAMVAARERFLGAGHTAGLRMELARTVAAVLRSRQSHLVVDAGAGTGYYLAGVLDLCSQWRGVALDASKYALRRAAHAHPRIGAVGCDIWSRLPLKNESAALVLNIFSPRNAEEFHRILAAGGYALVVTPATDHLLELVTPLGLIGIDPYKRERLHAGFSRWFEEISSKTYRSIISLQAHDIETLVCMGPSCRHAEPTELRARIDRLTGRGSTPVTFSVVLSLFRTRRESAAV